MSFSFPQTELDILKFWQQQDIFKKCLASTATAPAYVFYDGPPFATGLPHHGHLLASTIKDIIPRYKTMQGYHVERAFGWDCHGVPIEHEIDKLYNKPTADVVADLGVAGYNNACRDVVMRYSSSWQQTITRLGRWVDFDNGYKTLDKSFMESVWWVFAQLWQQDLIYRGTKVVPYSTALGTVLSNFEAGSNYQDVQDPSVVILFKLVDEDSYLAAWTTTPWTLPANLGLCVGMDITYVKVRDIKLGQNIIIAKERFEHFAAKHELEVISEIKGESLLGRSYQPLFDYYSSYANSGAFKVFAASFISTKDGTGIVHAAPAFGEDDYNTLKAAGLTEIACPLDSAGCFTAVAVEYEGQYVKDADKNILRDLKSQGLVYEHETCVHSYPFCPRSDTPLIYRAIPSWYVNVEVLKERLIVANDQINWVPEHIKDGRFGKWLEGARDWAISRNRVWGTPLPVWQNDQSEKYICIDSAASLEKLSGVAGITDLHRDVVDDITFTIAGEDGVYRRITEVLDCWFESGAMPYAQNHYPFENRANFESNFPAQFIAEGLDQTRGWFYTLNVLSVALFDKPAFENVIVSGIIAAADGKKMSKRLRNYTTPEHLFDRYGADAMRLYMINSGLVKGQEQRFRDEGVSEVVRQTLLPFYNAFKFFSTYAKVDQWQYTGVAEVSENIVDNWLFSRRQSLFLTVTKHMDSYHLYEVLPEIIAFIDELTNIYIRLNRQRFWVEDMTADKYAAYSTLYAAIYDLALCLAPFAPFISEYIYQQLRNFSADKNMPESVHLCRYHQANKSEVNVELEQAVGLMQQVLVLGRQRRNDLAIKVKIPLRSVLIVHRDKAVLAQVEQLSNYIKTELNVKQVLFSCAETEWICYDVKPVSPILGKRLGAKFGHFRSLINAMDLTQVMQLEHESSIKLDNEVFSREEILLTRKSKGNENVVVGELISIVLDVTLDDDLLAEGMAREIVNRVQKTRKDMDLEVDDRIIIAFNSSSKLQQIVGKHSAYICRETLAVAIKLQENLVSRFVYDIDGEEFIVTISKNC